MRGSGIGNILEFGIRFLRKMAQKKDYWISHCRFSLSNQLNLGQRIPIARAVGIPGVGAKCRSKTSIASTEDNLGLSNAPLL